MKSFEIFFFFVLTTDQNYHEFDIASFSFLNNMKIKERN